MAPKRPSKEVAELLFQQGYISRPREVEPGVFIVRPLVSWARIAKAGSIDSNGQWKWAKDSAFRSIRGDYARFMDLKSWNKMQTSRALVKGVTGAEPKTSLGSLALQMLTWTGAKQEPEKRQKIFQLDSKIGYFDCQAGEFEGAKHYDIAGCYFQLIERLGGLKVNIEFDGNAEVMPSRGEVGERWKEMTSQIAGDKPLRNALWGSALGKTENHSFYNAGNLQVAAPYCGPLQTGALLVARLAYELCQSASYETNAVYSQTDGIITQHEGPVMAWKRYDMDYRLLKSGKAIIQGRAAYKVGSEKCGWYDELSPIKESEARPPFPQICYSNMFLLR